MAFFQSREHHIVNSFNTNTNFVYSPNDYNSAVPSAEAYPVDYSQQRSFIPVSLPSLAAPSNNPYDSIEQNVKQFICSVEGVSESDALENDDGSKIEEIDDAEDVVTDDDRPVNRTYFINCQTVYSNSFNAQGVKVRDVGNHLPQVSYRGGTVIVRPSTNTSNEKQPTYTNEGASSSQSAALAQSSRSLDALLDSTFGSPPVIPPLPFQPSSSAQSGPSNVPAIEIPTQYHNNNSLPNQSYVVAPPADIPLPTLGEGHASMSSRKRDKLPATSNFTPKRSATTTLPGPEFQPFPVNPFLPMHMGIHPSFRLPSNLEPLTDPQHHPALASNSSQYPLDTNSKRLEYFLESALSTALTIQTSGISSSADILSLRAHNTLQALNALVSAETPVSGPRTVEKDPPARFGYLKKVTKWLRIPQSPKQDSQR